MKRLLYYVPAVVIVAWAISGLLMHLGMQRHAILDLYPARSQQIPVAIL